MKNPPVQTSREFLHLQPAERREVLLKGAETLGISATVLEKDFWVCWTLHEVFALEGLNLAFKGGTSLSKVYKAIERFSEDVDLTLHCPGLESLPGMSNKKREDLSVERRAEVAKLVKQTFKVALEQSLERDLGLGHAGLLEIDPDHPEHLRLIYPSVTGKDFYLREGVLLEFGGRNSAEPAELHAVTPDLARAAPEYRFPIAQVRTLSAMRTYWEKVTLLHAEVQRTRDHDSYKRLSRHLYDLYQLDKGGYTEKALEQRPLLQAVIEVKTGFYRSAGVDYTACSRGEVKLRLEGKRLKAFRKDYQEMRSSDMFAAKAPSFKSIVSALEKLEQTLNAALTQQDPLALSQTP